MPVALRDLEARRTELERVDAVARSVDEWLAKMVEGLREHFAIDRASLRVIDPEDGEVVFVGQYVEHPTALPVGTRVPYRATSFLRAARERRAIMSIDEDLALAIGSLRVPSGVMVAAHAEDRRAAAVSLSTGDVIHSINGASVSNLEELRTALDALKPHAPVVLQIERDGMLSFLTFELD